jgi:hypothetical protein
MDLDARRKGQTRLHRYSHDYTAKFWRRKAGDPAEYGRERALFREPDR